MHTSSSLSNPIREPSSYSRLMRKVMYRCRKASRCGCSHCEVFSTLL